MLASGRVLTDGDSVSTIVFTSVKWSICVHPELRKAGALLVDSETGGGGGAGSFGGGGLAGRGAKEVLVDPTAAHPPDFAGGLGVSGRDETEPIVAQLPGLKPLDALEVAEGATGATGFRPLKPALLHPLLLPAVLTVAVAASGAT